jgi:hypothetical protein
MQKLKFGERAAIRLTLRVRRFASYSAVTGKKVCYASSIEGWIPSVGSARGPHPCAFLVPARLAPKLRIYGIAIGYSTVTPPDKGGPGGAGLRIRVNTFAAPGFGRNSDPRSTNGDVLPSAFWTRRIAAHHRRAVGVLDLDPVPRRPGPIGRAKPIPSSPVTTGSPSRVNDLARNLASARHAGARQAPGVAFERTLARSSGVLPIRGLPESNSR